MHSRPHPAQASEKLACHPRNVLSERKVIEGYMPPPSWWPSPCPPPPQPWTSPSLSPFPSFQGVFPPRELGGPFSGPGATRRAGPPGQHTGGTERVAGVAGPSFQTGRGTPPPGRCSGNVWEEVGVCSPLTCPPRPTPPCAVSPVTAESTQLPTPTTTPSAPQPPTASGPW